jgi:hypothetical protein
MAANDVRILPTEWVGTCVGATWGINNPHNPKHDSHGHLDPEWHSASSEIGLRIVRQEGRSLELLRISADHESKAVGALSSDGRSLIVVSEETTAHLTIDGDSMVGDWFTRPHASERRTGTFSAIMAELTAKS